MSLRNKTYKYDFFRYFIHLLYKFNIKLILLYDITSKFIYYPLNFYIIIYKLNSL